jgi:glucan 1,3-beta-glucosidase
MMQNLFNAAAAQNKIVYFDYGAYLVSDTVQISKDLKITGELWPLIMATGPNFQNQFSPRPMWRVGNPGEVGTVEITDVMFETRGPAPGCIIVEWNIKQSYPGGAGMWEAHYRIGGSAGTLLQQTQCLKDPPTPIGSNDPRLTNCAGAFLLFHITPQANAYLENVWGWVSDHELDELTQDQITIFNGR